MKSLIIGISRPGDPDNVLLSPGTDYLSRCGSYPEVTFSIDCKQADFYENIKGLRYKDGDPSSSSVAISFFQKLMSDIFNSLQYLVIDNTDKSPLHIRLITTPMELAQLPFEFVPALWNSTGVEMAPLLTNPERIITLTREVLLKSEARYIWPKQPRILFAWAKPLDTVPFEDHRNALVDALKPLIKPKKDIPEPEPDTNDFLTELPNASLKLIKEEIKKAIEDRKPYSHIHILAHGGHIVDFTGVVFRLLLCDDDPDSNEAVKANGDCLINAIIPDNNETIPIVVTLSACDSANTGNVLVSSGSLVYQLHRAGIPCVFASQFPLTQQGSIDLIKSLYSNLVNACDPREALHEARVILKNNNTHDWASLVAYARFPEDINEQLQAIRLRMLFTSMKTTGVWVDHVLKYKDVITGEKKEAIFKQIENRVDKSIEELSEFLTPAKESMLETEALRSEHLGLLGSAYKRKAEFLYRLSQFNPQKKQEYIDQSTKALYLAKDFYYGGYDADITNHWTAIQYLSLKAALGESIEADGGLWHFIQHISEKKEEKAKKANNHMETLWAMGTLAELYMLKPLTGSQNLFEIELASSLKKAKDYIIAIRVSKNEDVIDSTARQLDRYISWWPVMYPETFRIELKEMAMEIRNELLK